jgi:hypothetical protein
MSAEATRLDAPGCQRAGKTIVGVPEVGPDPTGPEGVRTSRPGRALVVLAVALLERSQHLLQLLDPVPQRRYVPVARRRCGWLLSGRWLGGGWLGGRGLGSWWLSVQWLGSGRLGGWPLGGWLLGGRWLGSWLLGGGLLGGRWLGSWLLGSRGFAR